VNEHRPYNGVAALRLGSFRAFAASGVLTTTAQSLLDATVAWQVYEVSESAIALGLLGIVRFVPSLLLSLVSGVTADRYDRRMVVICARTAIFGSMAGLFMYATGGSEALAPIYALVLLNAVGSTFDHPARNALLPLVIPRPALSNAITIDSTVDAVGVVIGPLAAGFIIAAAGVGESYLLGTALMAIAVACLFGLRPVEQQERRTELSLAAVREGIRFVFHRQVLLAAMTLDLFAVIFGGAVALLPIYAEEILEVGPRGYGVLASSMQVGAMLMGFVLVFLPPIRHAGRAMILAVACFGAGTIVFGLSRWFPLSVLAYASIGAADQVSYVVRHMMVPMLTPDELRGRVGSVNLVFIDASNQLGAAESGFVAGFAGATFAVVSGGVACIGALGVVTLLMPALRRYVVGPQAKEVLPSG
jgi:MFS family permease